MRKPGEAGGRESDPDNCRQRETELGYGQKTTRHEITSSR